jgi:hypothetical protein
VTEHAFPSIKILTTNGTGDRVVVGFLVAFSVVCPLKLFSADGTGIGLRRLDVGFHVAGEVALLRKLFPTFVIHVLLKRYNRNICYVWVKSSIFFIPVLRFDRLFCLCDAYIFSGMALL